MNNSTQNTTIPGRIVSFAKAEPVFTVALIAALLSALAVPPSFEYIGYIKWRTLGLLTMFMLCVAGLQKAGVFERVAETLVGAVTQRSSEEKPDARAIVAVLVALPYISAMFVTNDVSLLTFVPFAILLLVRHDRADLLPLTLTLQTIAANAGSYLTPFGNPHNLLAYTLFDVPFGEFIAAMAPFTIGSGVLLAACIALFGNGARSKRAHGKHTSAEQHCAYSAPTISAAQSEPLRSHRNMQLSKKDALLFGALFLFSVICVLKIVPVRFGLPIVAAVVALRDLHLFAKVDWLLLGTFVCFFIFSSNLAAIPAVSAALTGAMTQQPFWITLGASQVISNVPSCTLLAPFTTDWAALAIGANLGGLGSPVGSLASLITLGFYRRQCGPIGPYMKTFLLFNFVFLAFNCLIWIVLF